MGEKLFDFSGWATRNDLRCSDGRTIRKDAFKHCDGLTVPLVWNHRHDDVEEVLGHCLLENRDEGVYAYGFFNDTQKAQDAKLQVQHGDISALSIYANQLQQRGSDVLHGAIREVSLVLAGANPGAYIDNVTFAHSAFAPEEEAVIYTGEPLDLVALEHAEEPEKEKKEMAEETKKTPEEGSDKTIQDVINSMTDEQKNAMYFMVGKAIEESSKDNSEGGKQEMKHNVFDTEMTGAEDELIHTGLDVIVKDGKRFGSLKESFLAHADEYGIKDIDWLFPDAKNLTDKPGFVKRQPDNWVEVVMNGVHHTPFSRIKMMFADLREDDARAKGYAKKGALKKEEVFGLIKRTVEPTTIYKKQKLDRDDTIDITDFDVISWLKGEMRMMLDEEIARAILFSDGRSASSDDKISETNIIPVCKDASLYNIAYTVKVGTGETEAEAIVDGAVRAQNDYEGSGNTTAFLANSQVTELLLVKDKDGHRLYKDLHEVALAMGVSKITKVPDSIVPADIYGVILDLNDYNVGADKGGSVNMFDDFDIDYNQMKYLIETRCSGALTKPFSAITLKKDATQQAAG